MAERAQHARVRAAIEEHYEALWRFVRRLGVAEHDAEDAVQRVLLIFAQRITSVEAGAERAFLFGSALRIASDVRRKRARSREVADGESMHARIDPLPNAEAFLEQHQLRRWLDEVLDTLPDDLRKVFVLVELEEMSMVQISQLLEIPPGTVASRLRRSRELFERGAAELRSRLQGAG